MITIEGGKAALYQWDLNQRLVLTGIDAITAGIEVHYSSIYDDVDECCAIAPTYSENGNFYADIPNKMLQQHGIISAYLYVQQENKAWTEHRTEILVIPRNKPANYVYTETEIWRYEDLEKRLTDFEKQFKERKDVSYGEVQKLTDEQKERARTNIGIEQAVLEILLVLGVAPLVIDGDGTVLTDYDDAMLIDM